MVLNWQTIFLASNTKNLHYARLKTVYFYLFARFGFLSFITPQRPRLHGCCECGHCSCPPLLPASQQNHIIWHEERNAAHLHDNLIAASVALNTVSNAVKCWLLFWSTWCMEWGIRSNLITDHQETCSFTQSVSCRLHTFCQCHHSHIIRLKFRVPIEESSNSVCVRQIYILSYP